MTRLVLVETILSAVTDRWQPWLWGSSRCNEETRCRLSLGLDTDASRWWLMRLGRKNQSRTIKTSFINLDRYNIDDRWSNSEWQKKILSKTSSVQQFLETKGANFKTMRRGVPRMLTQFEAITQSLDLNWNLNSLSVYMPTVTEWQTTNLVSGLNCEGQMFGPWVEDSCVEPSWPSIYISTNMVVPEPCAVCTPEMECVYRGTGAVDTLPSVHSASVWCSR